VSRFLRDIEIPDEDLQLEHQKLEEWMQALEDDEDYQNQVTERA